MSRLALRNKSSVKSKFPVRDYHRCGICGRVRGYPAPVSYVQNLFSLAEPEG